MRKEKAGTTEEKILQAARIAFADNGFSGTSMDEIAQRAGVNKATLYYQIGDKDTLYASVIHQVLGNIAQDVIQAVGRSDLPEVKLEIYINTIVAAVDRNPELPAIMMRELAGGGTHLPRLVVEDIASVLTVLWDILEAGRRQGIFADVVPFLIHVMIMGTILFYKKGEPIKDAQAWLPAELKTLDRKLESSLGDAVANLVLKAIHK